MVRSKNKRSGLEKLVSGICEAGRLRPCRRSGPESSVEESGFVQQSYGMRWPPRISLSFQPALDTLIKSLVFQFADFTDLVAGNCNLSRASGFKFYNG